MKNLDKKCRECIIDGSIRIDYQSRRNNIYMRVFPKFDTGCDYLYKTTSGHYCNNQDVIEYRLYDRRKHGIKR